MRKHNFAFIDIETTGLNLLQHEIIEIGCVLTTPELDLVALKVNHYKEENWESAQSLEEGMKIFSKKIKDCIMVGHNVSFDAGFLEYAFNKVGKLNTLHYHKLDTISIAWAKFHNDKNFEHFSLREMGARFDIKNERAHTALSDARATYELYKKLMEL